jgi:hypothetical protein
MSDRSIVALGSELLDQLAVSDLARRTLHAEQLERAALRYTAAKIRESGEVGTARMADYVESLELSIGGHT